MVCNGKASTPHFRKPPSAKDLLCTCIGSTQRKDGESTVQQKLATFHHFLFTMTRTGQKGCPFAGPRKQTGQSVCCLACKARPLAYPQRAPKRSSSRCHHGRTTGHVGPKGTRAWKHQATGLFVTKSPTRRTPSTCAPQKPGRCEMFFFLLSQQGCSLAEL